jgi:hypothetical protein
MQRTFDYSMHTQPNDHMANISEVQGANEIGNEDDAEY